MRLHSRVIDAFTQSLSRTTRVALECIVLVGTLSCVVALTSLHTRFVGEGSAGCACLKARLPRSLNSSQLLRLSL